MEMVLELKLPRDSECLDLGAGSGAFSVRLKDHGFKVDSVELTPLSLEREQINVHCLDLNGPFHETFGDRRFQLITCLEVIEHLENPFHLFRSCARLLRRGDHLLVSSPNLESWMARLVFLATGELPWFGEKGWKENRHTIPQFSWQVPIVARQAGFTLVERRTTDNRFMLYAGPAGLVASVAKRLALVAARPLMRGNRDGDVNIFLFRLHSRQAET
jgi:SAM-dependent methyltransferase